MLRTPLILAAFLVALAGASCRGCDGETLPSELVFSAQPEALEFRATEVGASREEPLRLRNQGRATLNVALRHPEGSPFRLPQTARLEAGEEVVVTITFAPEMPGRFDEVVELEADGRTLRVTLGGTSVACESGPCSTNTFDEASGACVETVHADGSLCKTACLIGGHCQTGTCIGFDVDCDDGNACTRDTCVEPGGCVHEDSVASCPAPEEACHVPYCDADAGCGVALAPDGTACESHCTEGQCESGICIGTPRNCDDGNPCTLDTCAPESGCAHENGTSRCPVPNTCQAPVCDPKTGCATVALADGTPCGTGDCNGIHVCNAGQCVVTPVLDAGCGCNDIRTTERIMTGVNHSCRITATKTVECWGANWYGALGDGTFDEHWLPTAVPGLSNVVELAETESHTCALTGSGRLYCWGANLSFQVHANASYPYENVPFEIKELGAVVSVSGKWSSTCAVRADGTVWCWGDAKLTGRTGYGFVRIDGIEDAVAVSVGDNSYGCAILRDSTMKCWGSNGVYELGDGTTSQYRRNPVHAVTPNGLLRGVVDVSAGPPTVVRTLSGQVLAAMYPYFIAPGTEATFPDAGPWFTPVALGGCATQVSSYEPACARMADGTARCFGRDNQSGVMGTGTTTLPPLGVSNVSGIGGVAEIRTSPFHSCAAFEDGGYRCWGQNTYGQLGDGTNTDRYAP